MNKTRREFLAEASLGVASGIVGAAGASKRGTAAQEPSQQQPAGTPPAFGTAPAVGPEVSVTTFTEAEKLVRFPLTASDRAQAAASWRGNMASLYERRPGDRKLLLEPTL